MLIGDLQRQLRQLVRERIAAGDLTGAELARRAGFQQAHISNFLNGRRGFSIESMDRVMEALQLQVCDLSPVPTRGEQRPDGRAELHCVPVVRGSALRKRQLSGADTLDLAYFKKSLLTRIRPEIASERQGWQRFVAMRVDGDSGAAMRSRIEEGALLLIDRHYNSLRNYRRGVPNLYVVRCGAAWLVRYVEMYGDQLTLRPESSAYPLHFIPLRKTGNLLDYVVGRVTHVFFET
jgi:transcriptional regulator with XRE-family HTH domain